MADPIVELRNVTFGYGATPAVRDINLHMHRGQFAGLVGPSGAGKTTILRLILGLLTPTRGTVFIEGMDLKGTPSPCVAYVPQIETIDWNFPVTVNQVVLMGRTRQHAHVPWASRKDHNDVESLLEKLGLAGLGKRHIRDLSGGQQQRVFLARALLAEPDLLVLDEPTVGVDLKTQENVLHLLADLNHEGVSILMTTHDLNAAASHLPWVFCINRDLIACGTPDDVFTPEILSRTYRGNIVTFRHDEKLYVGPELHGHSYRDVVPSPVPGDKAPHPSQTPPKPPLAKGRA